MSFWDKLGQAWDSLSNAWNNAKVFQNGQVLGPGNAPALSGGMVGHVTPGLAWESAKANVDPNDRSVLAGIAVGAQVSGMNNFGAITNDVYSHVVARPISTALIQGNSNLSWSQAWDASETISPGQANIIAAGQGPVHWGDKTYNLSFDQTPEAQAQRDAFFRETWLGRLTSGALDLSLNMTADPINTAGAAAKSYRASSLTFKAGDLPAIATGLREGAVEGGSRRIERGVRQVNTFISQTDNAANAGEIAAHPLVKGNPAQGYIATLFDQANKSFPGTTAKAIEARRQAKLDIWLTLMGDSESASRLAGRQAQLSDALDRISAPPPQTTVTQQWADYWNRLGSPVDGSHPIEIANPTSVRVPPHVEAQRAEIMAQIRRLDEAVSAQGSVSKIGTSVPELIDYSGKLRSFGTTTVRSGFFGRAVVVMSGALGNRLEGHVSLRDPVAGYQQLDEALRQAGYMTGQDRAALLDRWTRAVSDGDRQGVVRAAEAAIVHSTALHYGLSAKQAEDLIRAGDGTRRAVYGVMRTRLYSAMDAGDNIVAVDDPERDITVVKSRPLAQSQIEDFHPLVDPRQLDALFRAGTHNRLFENIGSFLGQSAATLGSAGDQAAAAAGAQLGRNAGRRLYSVTDPMVGLTVDALSKFMRLWKDATLLPRLAAYGARVQMDTQGRLAAHMGMLNYLGALPKSTRMAFQIARDGKALYKGEDTVKVLTPWLTNLGFSEDEAGALLREMQSTGGGMADLLSNASYSMHQKLMATDNWGRVQTNDPLWMNGYIQAVRQIRNSPVMQEVIKGADDNAIKQFLYNDPAGRREWLELRGTWENDIDAYIEAARQHVDHYLPDATTKQFALKSKPFEVRPVTEEGIRRYFDGVNGTKRRMEIHGEAYSPVTPNKYNAFIANSREHLYSLVSDTPETVLGRVPLFVHEFKKEYARILDNLTAGGHDVTNLETAAKARTAAARIAKRNVAQILYDSSHTSNLATHFRLIAPFFAAWEDMMKKWGRLLYNDPSIARKFQQAWDAPTDAGITKDEYGNEIRSDGGHYFLQKNPDGTQTAVKLDPVKDKTLIGSRTLVVVPASFIPPALRHLVGDPKDFRLDQKSFNVIFQGDPVWLPGPGPLLALPTNEYIRRAWPEGESNPVIKYLLPYGTNNDPTYDQVLPAWAKNFRKASPLGNQDDYRQQMSYLYKQEYIKWQQGKRKTEPTLDEIANKSRNWFVMRGLTSLISPFTATPSQELQFYIDQAHQYKQLYANMKNDPGYQKLLPEYQAKYGIKNADKYLVYEHPEYQGADERFYHDFPEYFDLAVSVSTNDTGLVANLATVSKMKKYSKEMSKYSEWAWAIAGPDNAYGLDPAHAFNSSAYNYQQLKNVKPGSGATFRSVLPADEALATAEAQKGWIAYMKMRTTINLVMQQNGINSLADSRAAGLKALLDSKVEQLGQANPYWLREFGKRDETKAVSFMNDMSRAMQSNKALAKEPQMAALQKYITSRNAMMQVLEKTGYGINAQRNKGLADLWGRYVQQLIASSPGFEQIYNRILDQDQLTMGVIG